MAPAPTATTIAGGHVEIGATELVLAWTAYQEGFLKALDLRVWLASYEVAKRREWMKRDREAVWSAKELHALVGGGGGERSIRASVRKLARLSLVTWDKAKGPKPASKLEELEPSLAEALDEPARQMLDLMPSKRRFFPLQRRILRLLTGGVKRSVLATVLGHSLRCLYRDKVKGWRGVGACSASWVAETFCVGESSVRRARAHLSRELGWLTPLPADQWYVNRYGGRFEVDLEWEVTCGNTSRNSSGNDNRRGSELAAQASCPKPIACDQQRVEFSTAEMRGGESQIESGLRGPVENRPLPKRKIQKSDPSPEGARLRADSCSGGKGGTSPKLTDVRPEDLASVSTVMELYDQALSSPVWQERGWAPRGDFFIERLNWAASAHRARVRGGGNPAGLFIHLVSKKLWGHVSNEDEDAVRAKLSAWRDGEPEDGYVQRRQCVSDDFDEGYMPPGYLEHPKAQW
ncbi:MAG: hypothetical protein AAFY15_00045 [Cyanobacteria bacterium J06648_11]